MKRGGPRTADPPAAHPSNWDSATTRPLGAAGLLGALEGVAQGRGRDDDVGTRVDHGVEGRDRERRFRGFLEADGLIALGSVRLGGVLRNVGHFLRGFLDAFAGGDARSGGSARATAVVGRGSGTGVARGMVGEPAAEFAEELAIAEAAMAAMAAGAASRRSGTRG